MIYWKYNMDFGVTEHKNTWYGFGFHIATNL